MKGAIQQLLLIMLPIDPDLQQRSGYSPLVLSVMGGREQNSTKPETRTLVHSHIEMGFQQSLLK